MNLTDYKPGRRLDAMVAMCLGWRWKLLWEEGAVSVRSLYPSDRGCDDARIDDPLAESWNCYMREWSTNDGAAFEAALEAGVVDRFAFKHLGGYIKTAPHGIDLDWL